MKEQPLDNEAMKEKNCQRSFTRKSVRMYLDSLNGHATDCLHQLVMNETEKGLITEVLDWCEGNQSQAAGILGMTRTTLRNKIRKYKITT